MTTIFSPRVPKVILHAGERKRFHTIHLDNNVFTVQKNGTSVLAFRQENDVKRFSKLIESHFDLTHEWPVINFEDTLLFRNTKLNRLKYVDIIQWEEDKLITWCVRNAFSMLDIHQFEGDNRLVGKSIFWDFEDDSYYRTLLFEKYNQSQD